VPAVLYSAVLCNDNLHEFICFHHLVGMDPHSIHILHYRVVGCEYYWNLSICVVI
jgi:hypothetical protein